MSSPSGFTQKMNLLNIAPFTNIIISPLAFPLLIFITFGIYLCTEHCPKLLPLHTPVPSMFWHQKPFGLIFLVLPCPHCSWMRLSTVTCAALQYEWEKAHSCAWFFFFPIAHITVPEKLRANIYIYMLRKRKQLCNTLRSQKLDEKGAK